MTTSHRRATLRSRPIPTESIDVDVLLQSGWSELQIAEAVHVTALFARFNRVPNAFGLAWQQLLALYNNDQHMLHAENAGAKGTGS
jgi:hypothetical protein